MNTLYIMPKNRFVRPASGTAEATLRLLLASLLLLLAVVAQGQVIPRFITPGCTVTTSQSLSLVATGGTTTTGTLHQYVLTNGDGIVVQVATTPNFGPKPAGGYLVYDLVSDVTSPVTGLAVGASVTAVTGTCVQFSNPLPVIVCPEATACSLQAGQSLSLTLGGGNTAGATLKYYLVDETGQIVAVSNTPVFSTVAKAGVYYVYELALSAGTTVSTDAVGQLFTGITLGGGLCYDFSDPLVLRVCPASPPTVAINTPVNNATVNVASTVSGTATPNSAVVLTSSNNTVLCSTTATATGSYSCVVTLAPGSQTITAVASNSAGSSTPASVRVTVLSPFMLTNTTATISTSISLPVSASAATQLIPTGGVLTYTYQIVNCTTGAVSTSSAQGGLVTISTTTGAYVYTPALGFTGTDTFCIRVCDSATPTASCQTATITVNVSLGNTCTLVPNILTRQ
jgi:Bacterial Ig domain